MRYSEAYSELFYDVAGLLSVSAPDGQIRRILRSLAMLFKMDAVFIYSSEPPSLPKLTACFSVEEAPKLPQTVPVEWLLLPQDFFPYETIVSVPFYNEDNKVIGAACAARISDTVLSGRRRRDLVSLLLPIGGRVKMQILQGYVERIAFYDSLTGVFNRRKFEYDFQPVVERSLAKGTRGYVLFFDLDRFKMINDMFGHKAGDRLLIDFAQFMQTHPDFGGHVYRLGGDEFVMVLEDCTEERVLLCAQTMLNRFAKPWKLTDGNEAYCTASIGIACFPEDSIDCDELARLADVAMYTAKRRGKNCFAFFDPREDKAMPELDKEVALRAAVSNDCKEFTLMLLPIVDSKTGRWIGAECLVRWVSLSYGVLLPDDFLPMCRQLGLSAKLDEWIIKTAVELARTHFSDTDLYLGINASELQMQDEDFARRIAQVVRGAGCRPGQIIIEFSDPFERGGFEQVKRTVEALRDAGLVVAADGLGVAHRSLSILPSVKFDMVKVDCALGMRCLESEFDRELARALVKLSHTLDALICAEGVWNEDVKNFLTECGYDYLQGTYFSEPLQVWEFIEKFKKMADSHAAD